MSRRRIIGDILHKCGIINRFYITKMDSYMYIMYTSNDPDHPLRCRWLALLYFKYAHRYGL